MSTHGSSSSPVKSGALPLESRSARQAAQDIRKSGLISEVTGDQFLETYLPGLLNTRQRWSPGEQTLVDQIRNVPVGEEKLLYTGSSPLLRLLNSISRHIFQSLDTPGPTALAFSSSHNKYILNPFTNRSVAPDVVASWEAPNILERLIAPNSHDSLVVPPTCWPDVVTVGEVKVLEDGQHQLGNYIRHHLQNRPELNAVMGFTARTTGYELVYHDAGVIHRSTPFPWTPGAVYAFIRGLYTRPFRDPSMRILRTNDKTRAWATKIDKDVFIAFNARCEPGPGQRRFTATVTHLATGAEWFIKDIWRDTRRRYFEGLLYEKAHKNQHLPGLMSVDHYGYVLDVDGTELRTSQLGIKPGGEEVTARYKMRIASRDVGQSLENIDSLHKFLRVMYDACAVQRNLYRKSKILHRDISDSNVMIAPNTAEFRARCAEGYNEVKYINQVLAKNNVTKPDPACLVIDLGNGADLGASQDDREALAERTGTPKFIARSVSSGKLLDFESHTTDRARMPKLTGRALDLYQFLENSQYEGFNKAVDEGPRPDSPPEVAFTHQLSHDAESMFWVIAWSLARSARQGYRPETEWRPEFKKFMSTMLTHYPSDEVADGRSDFSTAEPEWRNVLHDDLSMMAPMISQMHRYIRPEWAFRQLDPEHAHEALMRLLLIEIVNTQSPENDIPLAFGVRSLPEALRLPSHRSRPTNSLSATVTRSQSKGQSQSLTTSRDGTTAAALSDNLPGPSSRKRDSSHLDGQVPRRSPRIAERDLKRAAASGSGSVDTEPAQESDKVLINQARQVEWGAFDCVLKPVRGRTGGAADVSS